MTLSKKLIDELEARREKIFAAAKIEDDNGFGEELYGLHRSLVWRIIFWSPSR